jgi:hypothetical protein
MAAVSTKEPDDENGNSPLTPIYAFNQPGEAIDLYSGPIGGLCDLALQGTIRLVPFPSADLRWQVDVPNPTDQSTVATVGDWVDLTAGGIAGRGMVSSTSFGSLAGISRAWSLSPAIPWIAPSCTG